MANQLTAVMPKLLAQGLLALREQSMMPMIINKSYDTIAGQKGSTIDVPIPSAITVQDVTPANTPPNTGDVAPTSVPITLDRWKEAPFYMSDKDMLEAMNGTIPMQASEAVKALANEVNGTILGMYRKFYGFVGTPGTSPFATDVSAATQARKVLNVQLAPMDPRYLVLDPEAEANALGLQPISNQQWRVGLNEAAIVSGMISRTLGFDWFMHQLAPIHIAGTASGYAVNAGGGLAVGATTIPVDTGTGTLVEGDILTFAGHTQTYVVTTAYAGGSGNVSIYPGLKILVPDNTAVSVKASHTVNIAMHRDAIAFATRPLENAADGLGALIQSAVDAVSGLTLRLEVTREHKRTRFSYDILYGCSVVRREFGVRIAG